MNLNNKYKIFFSVLILCFFTVQNLALAQFSSYVPFLNIKRILRDNFVNVPSQTWTDKATTAEKHQAIRLSIIKQIYKTNTAKFLDRPYSRNANYSVTVKENNLSVSDIPEKDSLDELIDKTYKKMGTSTGSMIFGRSTIEELWPIFLRKSTADLEALGYEVVSSRYRANRDAAYRRYNILTAFAFLGHTKVLNPGESIRYLKDVQFDERSRKNYKNGLAIVSDDEISVYGGGLCGGSTAAYQWFLTNTALDLGATNHSKWYSNLYTAIINGDKISTPGLDATVYAWSRELVVTNTSDHPVVLVMNFNGQNGGIEEILSLGLAQDKGSLDYVGKKGNCYTRKINGKNKTSCYKEVH